MALESNPSDNLSHGWVTRSDLQLVAQHVGTPTFVYSERRLIENVRRVHAAAVAAGIDKRLELFIPFFPNSNPHVLEPLRTLGVGLLLQLPSEYEILKRHGFDKFIVSPGHVSTDDIEFWVRADQPIFLSSLDEIHDYLAAEPRAPVNVRFDSLGSGKPGLKYSELTALRQLLEKTGRQLGCFEVYCGSGHSVEEMTNILEQVFMVFRTYFPAANAINFAGGYGFDYEEWEQPAKHFEWDRYLRVLRSTAERFDVPEHVKFLFEPARDILADVGILLLKVKRDLITNPGSAAVLTDGSRVLMPSAQYKDRRHNVQFLDASMSELAATGTRAALRGRSVLRHDYVLPGNYQTPEGISSNDYVVINDVGAYCATQHMEFLNVPPAAEVVIRVDGTARLVTQRGTEFDKWRHLLDEPKPLHGRDITHDNRVAVRPRHDGQRWARTAAFDHVAAPEDATNAGGG